MRSASVWFVPSLFQGPCPNNCTGQSAAWPNARNVPRPFGKSWIRPPDMVMYIMKSNWPRTGTRVKCTRNKLLSQLTSDVVLESGSVLEYLFWGLGLEPPGAWTRTRAPGLGWTGGVQELDSALYDLELINYLYFICYRYSMYRTCCLISETVTSLRLWMTTFEHCVWSRCFDSDSDPLDSDSDSD